MWRDETGALSPGFLAFLIAATVGIFFFIQLGHAHVLATESRTAADAAALAGAEHLRTRLGNGLALGAGQDQAARLDRGGACDAAAEYAWRNDARLVDCTIAEDSLDRPQYAVLVTVEGIEGPVEGPSDTIPEELPRARARAESEIVLGDPDPHGLALGIPLVGTKPVLAPLEGSERWRSAPGWGQWVLRVPGGDPNISVPSPDGYAWPACGPVTSEYGPRWGRMHQGIDMGLPSGTPLGAAKAGTVTVARNDPGGYGLWVEIDHGDGMRTRYGHMSGFSVGVGDRVDIGDPIGLSGNTGRSTGPHLHLELRVNGVAVNPRAVLPDRPC